MWEYNCGEQTCEWSERSAKGYSRRNLSELKNVARTTALLICEKIGVNIDHSISKKELFWKRKIEKDIAILKKGLKMIDDWFKGWLNNGSAKLNCELKLKYKLKELKVLSLILRNLSSVYVVRH